MENIEDNRKEIDQIDEQIVELLNKRMAVARKIGKIKREKNLSVFDEKRYNELIEGRVRLAKDKKLSSGFIKEIFELIHKESLKKQ